MTLGEILERENQKWADEVKAAIMKRIIELAEEKK